MTDKKDKGNIAAIRKGIVIDNEPPKLEPIPTLVELTARLHKDAVEGNMRELCFVSINADETANRGIVGEPYNFTLTQCHLQILVDDYFESATRPFLTGDYQDQYEE